jgi:hypothetical protein
MGWGSGLATIIGHPLSAGRWSGGLRRVAAGPLRRAGAARASFPGPHLRGSWDNGLSVWSSRLRAPLLRRGRSGGQ